MSALNKPLTDVVSYEVIFEDFIIVISVRFARTDLQEFKLKESHDE